MGKVTFNIVTYNDVKQSKYYMYIFPFAILKIEPLNRCGIALIKNNTKNLSDRRFEYSSLFLVFFFSISFER